MINDAVTLLQAFIEAMWMFFTSWKIPGFNFTPAQFILFIILFPIILNTVFAILSVTSSKKKDDD